MPFITRFGALSARAFGWGQGADQVPVGDITWTPAVVRAGLDIVIGTGPIGNASYGVVMPNHGLAVGDIVQISGAPNPLAGQNVNGVFSVQGITDANQWYFSVGPCNALVNTNGFVITVAKTNPPFNLRSNYDNPFVANGPYSTTTYADFFAMNGGSGAGGVFTPYVMQDPLLFNNMAAWRRIR